MMTRPLHILVVGKHPEILPTVIRLLQQVEGWQPFGTLNNDEALEHIHANPVDILLLSSGIINKDEQQLRNCLLNAQPDAIVIQHYGGGSGLLTAEIFQALAQKGKPAAN